MASIEGIRIRNYRVLRDITFGKLWYTPNVAELTPMTAVIGKNGVGKSSLFDAFGFLADCLKLGVEEACDERGRGGFDRIRSQGNDGPISFEISFRVNPEAQHIGYALLISKDESGRPHVLFEILFQHSDEHDDGPFRAFLMLSSGSGASMAGGNARPTNR